VILTDSGSGPVDASNDVVKFCISKMSNDDRPISGTGRPNDFVFDLVWGFKDGG